MSAPVIDTEKSNLLLGWQITSDRNNLVQTWYEIEFCNLSAKISQGKVIRWQSGRVMSRQSVGVSYTGPALQPGCQYAWRVRVGTNQGRTPWSAFHRFRTALAADKWKARWIGIDSLTNATDSRGEPGNEHTRLAARYLRTTFACKKPVAEARLSISGLGAYVAYINGKRVGNDVLAPAPTLYSTTVYYNTYDITSLLANGKNAIGVVLGNGRFFAMRHPKEKDMPTMLMFGLPRLKAQIDILFEDGTSLCVPTDTSWQATASGPIRANNEFDGESYDARFDLGAWASPNYVCHWPVAQVMTEPGGVFEPQPNPGMVVHEQLSARSVKKTARGTYLVDMGQNMVGWLKVQLAGKQGQAVTMRFAELLQGDTALYIDNLRTAICTDVYVPRSDGTFTWAPQFVLHGFRYVEISGVSEAPVASQLVGEVVYDNLPTVGTFQSSNKLAETLFRNAYWGIRGNYRGMPTDCPQRDERMGWLGDRATGAYGEAYVFDNGSLYKKWLRDIRESMNEEGSIPSVAPRYWTLYVNDVTWPSAYFNIAHLLYRHYADPTGIIENYDAMKKWVGFIEKTTMKNHIVTVDMYGDWCMPPERQDLIHSEDSTRKTDGRLLSTAVFFDILNKMVLFAKISGHDADIPYYTELARRVRAAYNKLFYHPDKGYYANNTVTANLLSIRLGLAEQAWHSRIFEHIVDVTLHKFGGHVSTGVVGIQHLMRGLTDNGRLDLAYTLLNNTDYPSWGYMIGKGATTIWELWNGDTANPAMNSANHVMLLGDLLVWYYEYLAGIAQSEQSTGFAHLYMEPRMPDGLSRVDASFESPYGRVESRWERRGNSLDYVIRVPANAGATVVLPSSFEVQVPQTKGVIKVERTPSQWVIEVASGNYRFATATPITH